MVFTVTHIAKYLGNVYDSKNEFLTSLDDDMFKKAKGLIKLLLFKINYNKKTKYTNIQIHDYTQSGFMGDIGLLIKLNEMFYNYMHVHLQNDLDLVLVSVDKAHIEVNIKKFIFLLLNYTLKLISIISEKISNMDRDNLKYMLLKCAVNYSYRINLFVQDQLRIINVQNQSIKDDYEMNIKIKDVIKTKMEVLMVNIKGNDDKPNEMKQNMPINNVTLYDF